MDVPKCFPIVKQYAVMWLYLANKHQAGWQASHVTLLPLSNDNGTTGLAGFPAS